MRDADARYLARIADDCRTLLGPDIELGLEAAGAADGVRLVAHLRLGDVTLESVGAGPTIVAAHADLRQRLVEDRVGVALRALLASR